MGFDAAEVASLLGEDFVVSRLSGDYRRVSGNMELYDFAIHRRDHDYLRQGLPRPNWYKTRTDSSVFPPIHTFYGGEGKYIMAKEDDRDMLYTEGIHSLARAPPLNLKCSRIETILGVLASSTGKEDYLVYSRPSGICLSEVSDDFPCSLKNRICSVVASALAELHSNDLLNNEPLPSLLTYDFSGRIVFHPGTGIVGKRGSPVLDEDSVVENLSAFLLSNRWVANHKLFFEAYSRGKNGTDHVIQELKSRVEGRMQGAIEDPDTSHLFIADQLYLR